MPRSKFSSKIFLNNVIAFFIAILLWEGLTLVVSSRYFPSPTDVLNAFITLVLYGDVEGIPLILHTSASISRVLAGFSLAAVTGIPLGLFMGLKKKFIFQ